MHRMKALLTRRGLTVVGLVVLAGVAGWLVPQVREARDREEALAMLGFIERQARAYYAVARHERDIGRFLPCQFPASQAPTPAATCCSRTVDKDGDGLCDGNPGAWNAATWNGLRFAMIEEHRFTYAFRSSGTDTDAEFVALAYGDLDCDGHVVTFQVAGRGQGDCEPPPWREPREESE